MSKVLAKIFIFVALFFATFYLLSRVDWLKVFRVDHVAQSMEEKLGDLMWEIFDRTETEIRSQLATKTIDSLVNHICEANDIDRKTIKVHLLRKGEVNAITLPDRHLVIFSGLIETCENQEELCGIIGHELAHMEKSHVMKKLIKEVGLSVLISMTSGKGSPEGAKQLAKVLSSSAYDRTLESEADITSVDYMIKADIDPEPFANFMYRLGDLEKNVPDEVYWVATHPESKERAETIIEYIKDKTIVKKQVISEAGWEKLKERLADI